MNIKITNLQRSLPDGNVKIVSYEASKNTVTVTGTIMLPSPTGTPIAFDKLTEAKVVEWLGTMLNLERIEAQLDAQLDAISNPVSATGLPWK